MVRQILIVAGVLLVAAGCSGTETDNPASSSDWSCGYPLAGDEAGQEKYGNQEFKLCGSLEPSKTCGDGVRQPGEVCFKLSRESASFQKLNALSKAEAFAVGDVDGDGHVDIVFRYRTDKEDAAVNTYVVEVYWGDGKGGWSTKTELVPPSPSLSENSFYPMEALQVNDADGDGILDVLLYGEYEQDTLETRIYFGSSGRDFIDYTGVETWGGRPIVADLTGDSVPDLIRYGFISAGLGKRRFDTNRKLYSSKISANMFTYAVMDIGSDGINDLIGRFNDSSPHISAFPYLKDGTLGAAIELPLKGFLLAADINADGRVDLVGSSWVPHSTNIIIEVSLADDKQEFNGVVVSTVTSANSQASVKAGVTLDLDGDGNLDLVLKQADPCTDSPGYPDLPRRLRALTLMMGDGKGKFSEYDCALRVDSGIIDFATADVNEDGAADLLILTPTGVQIWLANP